MLFESVVDMVPLTPAGSLSLTHRYKEGILQLGSGQALVGSVSAEGPRFPRRPARSVSAYWDYSLVLQGPRSLQEDHSLWLAANPS